MSASRPNVVFIFADQWRAQAAGYAGDPNARTPVLDRLAERSLNVSRAVSGCSVCCPYRASLITGQYPLTHGVFINDVELAPSSPSIARAFNAGGYRTGYIGKWHLYGSPEGRCERRKAYVPRSHQMGFDDWWGYECTHNYWKSPYFHNDDPTEHLWEGYDLFAQADHAADVIADWAGQDAPFMLMLSWGPPHFPVHTAPEPYRKLYEGADIHLRPNVPEPSTEYAREECRGYYAHLAALDEGLERVLKAIDRAGIAENTLLVVTSDHGDMLGSQGLIWKHLPFDESIRVPLLIRWPAGLGGQAGTELPLPLDGPDWLPTLAGLCRLGVPEGVQGRDWSAHLTGQAPLTGQEAALLSAPASTTTLLTRGIEPYRGLRTPRHTYVRTRSGPWLLFDNHADPYQMHNLAGDPASGDLQARLDARLTERLDALGDEFLTGQDYLDRAGLAHYREANMPLEDAWQSPWPTDGS